MGSASLKRFAGIALLASLLIGSVLILREFGADLALARQWGAALQSQGLVGAGLVLIGGAVFTAVGLPRQFIAFLCGFTYGTAAGIGLALTASLAGCALTFVVSRRYLRRFGQHRYPGMVDKLEALVRDDAFLKILLLRLQPFGTNLLTNVCAGLSSIGAITFLAASALGYIPQMLVFVLIGAGLRPGGTLERSVSIGLIVISLALALWLYRRFRHRQGFDPGT